MNRVCCLIGLLSFWGVFVWADGSMVDMAAIESQETPALSEAPVRVDGKTIFHVRGAPNYPAEKRADEISERISRFAAESFLSTATIKIIPHDEFSVIQGGDRFIMRVFDVDSTIPGLSHKGFSELLNNFLVKAILDFRQSRTPLALLKDTSLAALGLVLLCFLLWGWTQLYHRLRSLVEQFVAPRIKKIQTKSFDLIQAGLILEGMKGSMSFLHGGMVALLIYFHLGFVLRQFPWTRPFADGLLGLVLDPIRTLGISFVASLPGLMAVFVIGVVFYVAHRMLKLFFVGLQTGTIYVAGFDPDWAVPTFRIVRVALIALGVMLAYPHIPGSNSMAFKGVSVFLGIIISLGSSSFAANLIAGYSAIYRRAFRIGDWIEVNNFRGEVLEIQTLVTRLRSFRNEVIVIPNSAIINSPVINYSTYAKDRGLILHTTVGIGYETPWRQVEAMLLQAAARTPGLLTDPKSFCPPKRPRRLLCHLRNQRFCFHAGYPIGIDPRLAPKHIGHLQRKQRPNHDPGIRRRPGATQTCSQGQMVHAPR
ncbi:MAG: mechanosensitive ion channel [Elusimicrobia bacterium]|nr:mechanosensitive ion channel [Elusimicrobiota bacterium]